MTANIIKFPSNRAAAQLPAPQNEKVRDDSAPTKNLPRRGSNARSDGRRMHNPKSRSVEPNIQEIPGENGGCSYRVQIRKSVQGESVSFTKTFSKLAIARKWKKRKLAEIELDGVQTVSKKGDTVAAAITARVAKHSTVECLSTELAMPLATSNEIDDFFDQCLVRLLSDSALPHNRSSPAQLVKLLQSTRVTSHIRGELPAPKLNIAGRHRGFGASCMSMPVASMYQNCDIPLAKN